MTSSAHWQDIKNFDSQKDIKVNVTNFVESQGSTYPLAWWFGQVKLPVRQRFEEYRQIKKISYGFKGFFYIWHDTCQTDKLIFALRYDLCYLNVYFRSFYLLCCFGSKFSFFTDDCCWCLHSPCLYYIFISLQSHLSHICGDLFFLFCLLHHCHISHRQLQNRVCVIVSDQLILDFYKT